MSDARSRLGRMARGFARFWWDFLVGDTPEITVAVLVILGAVAMVSKLAHANTLPWVGLPVLVVLTLGLSVNRARRSAKDR